MESADRLVRLEPHRAALLVVDVQNDFCHPKGALAGRGADVSAAVGMIPRLRRLVDAAAEAGVRTIFVRTTHDESTDSAVWLSRTGRTAGTGEPIGSDNTCRTGTWGAEFYGVAPRAGDRVVVKHRYSAFVGTELDMLLRSAAVDSILVAGVATDVCVDSTIRDGLFREFHVTMVEDCCAAYRQESHEATVATVGAVFGLVASSDVIIDRWLVHQKNHQNTNDLTTTGTAPVST